MNLTDEQQAIVACPANTIIVKAPAGSGKTSTLVHFAKARPRERMLYLAFNRAIKEEAARKFPSNVRCVTTHGLAYAFFGPVYKHKLGSPKPFHVAQRFNVSTQMGYTSLCTLNAWLVSADPEMTDVHVIQGNAIPPRNFGAVLDVARKVWADMLDVSKADIPMPHDGYLKLYQLSGQTINTDRILFDEYQDSNPVTQAIVSAQRCRKVYIGDTRQAIYSFRGANDIMDQTTAEAEFSLTNSFRFGEGVASLANAILSAHDDLPHRIVGRGEHETVMSVHRGGPHTILARTNSMLFAEAISALESGHPFGFVGGVDNYRFDIVLDAHHLKTGHKEKVRDRFVRAFASFEDMEAYAEDTEDHEIKFLTKIVNKYRNDVPDYVNRIKEEAAPTLTGNEIIMTTGHKAKGLEWMDVVLTEDFTDLTCKVDKESGQSLPPPREEVNLLYVATTRAIRGIQIPEPLIDWFADNHPLLAAQMDRDSLRVNAEDPLVSMAKFVKGTIQGKVSQGTPMDHAGRRPPAPPGPSGRSGASWSEGEISNTIANWKFSKMDAETIARQSQRSPYAVMMKLASLLAVDIEDIKAENQQRRAKPARMSPT